MSPTNIQKWGVNGAGYTYIALSPTPKDFSSVVVSTGTGLSLPPTVDITNCKVWFTNPDGNTLIVLQYN